MPQNEHGELTLLSRLCDQGESYERRYYKEFAAYEQSDLLFFCLRYSSVHDGYAVGFLVWVTGLMIPYWYDITRNPDMPEYDLRITRGLSAFASWVCSIFYLGLFLDRHSLRNVSVILLVFLAVVGLFYSRKLEHERFNLGLVMRGEMRNLKEVEGDIQKNYLSGDVDLIDPTYSKENLCMVKESEWQSLGELKEKGLLTQEETESEREEFTFSCLLQGEMRYLRGIKTHIVDQYLTDGLIRSLNYVYSKERLYGVREPEWKAWKGFSGK